MSGLRELVTVVVVMVLVLGCGAALAVLARWIDRS
jgi:hypothetical protein